MADVITRLKLESTQYDSKLRDAANGLSEFARNAAKAGGEFQKLTDTNVEAARAFGNIATTSTNAKEKVRELVGAYNEVAKAYNNLTQEQQQSDFGKALSESLGQLKGRITEAKQELQSAGESMKSTSSDGNVLGDVLDKVAGKFGLNTSALGTLGIGLAATTGALKVAKDAFFASEASVDEWGRTIEAGKSLYEGFLFSLNTGDFSGFLANIGKITEAARNAYDALDRLYTMQRITAPGMSKQQYETDRLRQILQTGTYIAPTDGRAPTPGLVNGQRLSQDQLKTVERQLQGSIQRQVELQKGLINQTNTAIDAWYKKLATRMGMTVEEFRKGTSSMDEFDKRVKGGEAYDRWKKENATTPRISGGGMAGATTLYGGNTTKKNPYAQYKGWNVFRVDGDEYGALVDLIKQRDQQASQIVGMQAQAFRTINRVEGYRPTLRTTGGGGRGGARTGGGGRTTTTTPTYVPVEGSIDAQQAKVQALQKAWKAAADDDSRTKIKEQLVAATAELDKMQGKQEAAPPVGSLKYYSNWLKELQEQQQQVTTNNDWEFYAGQIDFVTRKMKELRGEVEIKPAEGSMTYLSDELKKLQDKQQQVTSTEEWKAYGQQIDEVTRKMKELRGELGGATSSVTISEKIEEMKKTLSMTNIGSEEYTKIQSQIIDATTFQNIITEAANKGISMAAIGIDNKALWNVILGGDNIPDDVWQSVVDKLNALFAEKDFDPIELNFKTGEVSERKKGGDDSITKASKALSGIGNIKGGLEAIGVKLPSGMDKMISVMQGVISVIQGVQTVISIFATTSQTANTVATTANTVALGALTAAMWSNTAASFIPFAGGGMVPHRANGGVIPHFANGGTIPHMSPMVWLHAESGQFVPGRKFSSDLTPIMANAGELILNRAQQGVIANALEGGINDLHLESFIYGEDIKLVLQTGNRRHGRGEYITSKTR